MAPQNALFWLLLRPLRLLRTVLSSLSVSLCASLWFKFFREFFLQVLRLLFWLKWKLTLRGYQRGAAQWIGAVLLLLIFMPAAVAIGGLCYLGFIAPNMTPNNQTHLLFAAFLGIYVLWLVAPLLGYAFNDSYDITRLFHYPAPMRQIFLSVVCGSLLDLPTLFLLPTVLGAFAGFTNGLLSALINLIAIALFLIQTFTLSQAIVLIGAGVVRGRRFRDSVAALAALAGTLYFLGSMAAAQGVSLVNWRELIETPAWQAVNYLPQGLAARAMDAARRGQFDNAVAWLVLLAAVTAATLALASHFVKRAYTEGGGGGASEQTPRQAKAERAGAEGFALFGGLPPALRALVEKEFAYIRRDPYFRLLFANFAYVIVFGISMTHLAAQRGSGGDSSFAGSGLLLLTELALVCNVFGTEGGAITLLFLTPAVRRDILLAKNLVYFLTIGAINLFYALLMAAISDQWSGLPLSYGWTLMSLVVFLSLGNFTSLYAPYRLVVNGWRVRRQSASKGFAYTMLYFGIMLLAFVLLLPVLAAFYLPVYFQSPGWLAIGVPLAALYAGGLYMGSIFGASRLMPDREEKIIGVVAQNDE